MTRARRKRRNPPPEDERPEDRWAYEATRRLDQRERWGRRVSPEAARRRRAARERYIRQMGADRMREIGADTRRRKALDKELARWVGVETKADTCKGAPRTCCRKRGQFAPCGVAGATEDFCFLPVSRPCCRDVATGRYAPCALHRKRQELADLERLHKQREAALARRKAAPAPNPPARMKGARIYPQVVAVIARKRASAAPAQECPACGAPNGSDLFIHKFQEAGKDWPHVPIVGLPDGSLLLQEQGSRLWGRR